LVILFHFEDEEVVTKYGTLITTNLIVKLFRFLAVKIEKIFFGKNRKLKVFFCKLLLFGNAENFKRFLAVLAGVIDCITILE
jgi:hypothetical protein